MWKFFFHLSIAHLDLAGIGKMSFLGDVLKMIGLFPVLKIATTTIPLTFFDFFTDIYAISGYAASPAWVVRATAVILGNGQLGMDS